MREFTRLDLGAVASLAMATATFPQVIFGVLAADLIFEFQVHRWQVGALVTGTGVVGALAAPTLGRLTDRIGALQSTRGVLYSSLGTLCLIAISPTYGMIAFSSLLSGAPQGWCNSATNSLIAENLPRGERGILTGIKQSGVQVGIFLGGALLPVFSGIWGWRLAAGAFVAIPIAGLVATLGRRSNSSSEMSIDRACMRERVSPVIWWVTVYGILAGLGTSAMITFLPLFAEEQHSWSNLQAGWLLAGVGLVGIAARIAWGALSESWLGHRKTLQIIAILTILSGMLLALVSAGLIPSWYMVLSALLLGVGGVSWNTIGMLAAMDHSPIRQLGRGTGFILFGFLLGYGVGAPIMGLSVDRLESYTAGWLGVSVLFLLATIVTRKIPGREVDPRRPHP